MKLGVTTHAVERYVERQKPALGFDQAKRELIAILEFATAIERPEWDGGLMPADAWLELAPDCVAIIRGNSVVSVVTRSLAEEPARRKQREIDRKTRIRKRSKRYGEKHYGDRRPEPRIESEAWPT